MDIAIIGSGYVGLVTGACFADVGHNVICVDNDEGKIKTLQAGRIPIYEPGLEEIVHRNVSARRLHFSSSIREGVEKSQIVFIAVPTPPQSNGDVDLSFIEKVSREIADILTDYRVIVDKSTVPVKTGERVAETIKRYNRHGAKFDVVSNPEFLREGCAIRDLMHPDRIVKLIRDTLWVLREKKIAVWGLTFKPNTDDVRSSVAIELVDAMLREGAHVSVYDPKGMEKARELKAIADAKFAASALEAVDGAEALVIATEWNEFANVDLTALKRRMTTPIVFDGRNLLNPDTMGELGFHYHSLGRASIIPR